VYVVGNTFVEPFKMFCNDIIYTPKRKDMILLDIQRPENFKYTHRLINIFKFANDCIEKYNIPVKMVYFKRLQDREPNGSKLFSNAQRCRDFNWLGFK
jgi:UDP-N-acetylglucosamine 2-epimerase